MLCGLASLRLCVFIACFERKDAEAQRGLVVESSLTPCFSGVIDANDDALTASAVCTRHGKTAEGVPFPARRQNTPLKQGVNETHPFGVVPGLKYLG